MIPDWAAISLAVATLIGAVVAGYRGLTSDRFQRRVDQRAGVIGEYEQIIKRLNEQHAADRAEWSREKAALRAEFDAEKAELRKQVEELQGQVYALMTSNTDTRRT